jgi:replicative DNA helicase
MSKEQIMYRLLSMEANINQMRLRSGKLYQNDWLKLNKIIKIFKTYHFLLMILLIYQFKIFDQRLKQFFLNKVKLD